MTGKDISEMSDRKMNAYFSTKRSGRGAAVWDFDNDGDLDIIVSHVDLPGNRGIAQE